MSIHEVLKYSAAALNPKCRYIFATLDESNATIFDQIGAGDFPVCLILPFDIVDGNREHGVIKSTAEINAIFLTRYPQATIDIPTQEVEDKMVAPMRSLARAFVNTMDKSTIMFEDGITSATYRSVHEAMSDAHLFGCWAVFTPSFTEDLTTCGQQDPNAC